MPVPLRKKKVGQGSGKFGVESTSFRSKNPKRLTVLKGVSFKKESEARKLIRDFKAQVKDKNQTKKFRERVRKGKLRVIRFK